VEPSGIVLFGRWHELNTWKQITVIVAEQLYMLHGANFERALQHRGTTRRYISRDPAELEMPELIGDSGLYIYTKFNRDQHVRHSRRLLKLFGYAESHVRVMEEIMSSDEPVSEVPD